MSSDGAALAPRLCVKLDAEPSLARAFEGERDEAWGALLTSTRARAFEAGRVEGERLARDAAVHLLTTASERIDAARELAAGQIAEIATVLAVEIARVVLRIEVDRSHYDLERIVRETLSQTGVGRGVCTVHLNPADAAALASVRFRAGTSIEADENIARGDVHVTTPRGLMVRELDEAVRAIGERLRGDAS